MKKKRISFIVIICIIIAFGMSVYGKESGVKFYVKSLKMNGSTRNVNVVEVNLKSPSVSLEVGIPFDKLGGAENFSSMLQRKKPTAAINANFFNAYDTLEPIGTIAKNGQIVFLSNGGTTMRITKDKDITFSTRDTALRGSINGKDQDIYDPITDKMIYNTWNSWIINKLGIGEDQIVVYTPIRGEKVKLGKGIAVVIQNQKVVKHIETPAQAYIPKNGYIIYVGAKINEYKKYVQSRFALGASIDYKYLAREGEKNLWDNVQSAITAGPRLLENGVIKDIASQGYKEPKIMVQRGQRSAVGVTKDKRLLMVTASNVTMKELAQIMKSLGAADALNLDGGASSGLYYKGKIVTKPGRNLSTVLYVYER